MSEIIYINSTQPIENMVKPNATWLSYAGTFYGLTPLSIVGVIMNLSAFLILCREQFQKSTIFKYLRYNVLNSLILCLILSSKFVTLSYKFDFTNTFAAKVYVCYFFAPLLSIFYLNGNLFDIFITIERILQVKSQQNIKKIIKLKYFWMFLITISFAINIPNFFVTIPVYNDIIINNSTLIRNYFTKTTDFANSKFGKILTYLIFFIRDIVTLMFKIGLNIKCVIYIKKYFNKIFNRKVAVIENNISFSTKHPSVNKMTDIDRNLTYIAITMSVLSSIENLFFIITYFYLAFDYGQIGAILYFFSNFIIAIKHMSNLIILYSFNSLFKKEFNYIFKR